MNVNIKNTKYTIVKSIDPHYVEVVVDFVVNGKNRKKFIFINKNHRFKNKDYLEEAKRIFAEESKHIRINKHNRISPLLITFASCLALASIGVGGYFIYKHLTNDYDHNVYVKLNVDEETSKQVSIEPILAKKNEDYVGTLTVKEKDHPLVLSDSLITLNDKELLFGQDYNIDLKDSSNGTYQYKITINSKSLQEDLSLHFSAGNIEDFKLKDEASYKNMLQFFNEDLNVRTVCLEETGFNRTIGYISSSYSKMMSRKFVANKEELGEVIYSRLDKDKYLADTYSRGIIAHRKNDSRYYSGITQLYKKTHSSGYDSVEFPTIINSSLDYPRGDAAYRNLDTLVRYFDFSSFKWNQNKARYEYIGESNNPFYQEDDYSFTVYKGRIDSLTTTKGYGHSNLGLTKLEGDYHFFYNTKDITVPNASEYYDETEEPISTTVSENEWEKLLTLDDSENLAYSSRGEYTNNVGDDDFVYNKNVYAYSHNDSQSFRLREGDKYYEIIYDAEKECFVKKESSDTIYNEHSYSSFKKILEVFLMHMSDYEFNQESGKYVNKNDDRKTIQFYKYISKDKSNNEIVISNFSIGDATAVDESRIVFFHYNTTLIPKLILPSCSESL